MPAKRHKHTFHSMVQHFGPYGRQNVHWHPCWDRDCDRVLIGQGRKCAGRVIDYFSLSAGTPVKSHWRETL